MISSITRRACAALLAFTLPLAALTPVQAQEQNDPEAVVRQVAGDLLQKLNDNGEAYRADPALLHDLVRNDLLPVMDVEYSARLILGRAGRDATDAQIGAFADTMSEVLIERYASGMVEYRNPEQLEVLPLRGELNERATRVRTRIRTPNGAHVPVDYMFRRTPDGWKAFDVIVEGISYVTTYRNQVMPQVQADGIEAVTARLRSGELQLGAGGDQG